MDVSATLAKAGILTDGKGNYYSANKTELNKLNVSGIEKTSSEKIEDIKEFIQKSNTDAFVKSGKESDATYSMAKLFANKDNTNNSSNIDKISTEDKELFNNSNVNSIKNIIEKMQQEMQSSKNPSDYMDNVRRLASMLSQIA